MKVLLYFEGSRWIKQSGIGRAMNHQMLALQSQGISYTLSPNDAYTIAHVNTIGPKSKAIINWSHAHNKKVIVHAHSTKEDFRCSFRFSNTIAPVFYQRLCHIYRLGDHLITPSEYAKSLLQGYGLKQPIHAISNGVDTEQFHYDEQKAKAFRKTFHLSQDQQVVVGVGFLFERKGIFDFVAAAKALPHVRFIWFGSHAGMLTPAKIRRLVKHPLSNVTFPGYVEGDLLKGALCGSDAFFFPSYEETEGIAVLEALACEQQVIVRDIGVYHPWLVHGKNCYKGSNQREMIQLLSASLGHRLPHLGKKGRICAQERNIARIGEELREVYEQVLRE